VAVLSEDLVEQRQPLAGDPLAAAAQETEELFFLAYVHLETAPLRESGALMR
jgi:hypothetical protein